LGDSPITGIEVSLVSLDLKSEIKLEKFELVDISISYDITEAGSDRAILKLLAVTLEEVKVGELGKVKTNSGSEYSVDPY
jgi:hypothetical protein